MTEAVGESQQVVGQVGGPVVQARAGADDASEAPGLVPQDPAVEAHPVVARVRRLAAELLAPNAAEVDSGVVLRSHLDALGAAGALGLAAPVDAGGFDAPAPVVRRVQEILAGADLSTWFVQAQHHGPVRMLATERSHPALLADLAAGRAVAGIAFSHLRRRPARVLSATPDGDGWRFDGTAPWYTGWGINDVALVGALTDDDRVVFALVPPVDGPHLRAGERVRTAALDAASTVPLTFDAYPVAAGDVVRVEPAAAWAAADALVTVNAPPAAFGLAESALTLLDQQGRRRREPRAVDAARRLADRLGDVRSRAYALLDDVPPEEATQERLALRAQALRLAVDAGTALVTAGAGGAMALASPAQRKAREALFLLVQGQTADVRAATLATFT
jgi:alkylation response protein AidB-like acyl-CoA dehydrogenase